jgi:hypothetical protein
MLTSYQTRAIATLSIAFKGANFTINDACNALLSPYGNTCATLRSLIKAGVACEVSDKTIKLITNKDKTDV